MKRVSTKAVKIVLRNQAMMDEAHANDLMALMVQVDRNLKKQRDRRKLHGRQLNVSARSRARRMGKRGGMKQQGEKTQSGLWLPR